MGLLAYLRGDHILDTRNGIPSAPTEERTLAAPKVTAPLLPYSNGTAPLNVTEANALRVADAYACVRVLADSVASPADPRLPPHPRRARPRRPRLAASCSYSTGPRRARRAPTSSRRSWSSLNVTGDAFVGKFRSDGQIVQLGLLDSRRVQVELRGQRIVYTVSDPQGRQSEHGPEDVLHIKAMGARRAARPVARSRSAGLRCRCPRNLQEHARQFFEHGSQPSGILTTDDRQSEAARAGSRRRLARPPRRRREHAPGRCPLRRREVRAGRVQRRRSPVPAAARAVRARGGAGSSGCRRGRSTRRPATRLTYANVTEQNRALVAHSLRPWLVRIERAITNDADLCPGGTYVAVRPRRAAPRRRRHALADLRARTRPRDRVDAPRRGARPRRPTHQSNGDTE